MSDGAPPIYTPFFGIMGATAAMVFSGKSSSTIAGLGLFYFSIKVQNKITMAVADLVIPLLCLRKYKNIIRLSTRINVIVVHVFFIGNLDEFTFSLQALQCSD